MYIDVVFTPSEFYSREIKEKSVTVIDVLRATSTIAYALCGYITDKNQEMSGCSKIIPVETLEEAKTIANKFDRNEVLLTGERFCLKPDGFDLGNSPKDYTGDKIKNKTIIFTTTNGTRSLKIAEKANFVTTSAFVNATASVNMLYKKQKDIIILCAGRSDKPTKEDAACAGLIAQLLTTKCQGNNQPYELSDSADIAITFFDSCKNNLYELLKNCEAGKNLIAVNLGDDLYDCSAIDLIDRATKFENGIITLV